jgi:hypothetical protein
MTMRKLGSALIAVAALMVVLGVAAQTEATPLSLVLDPEPDIYVEFVSTNYHAASDDLHIEGFPANIDAAGVEDIAISSGFLSLDAAVDGSGTLWGGSFTVTGTVGAPLNYASGTLLTGDLTALGFPDGVAGALEFRFEVTGGDAALLYGGIGSTSGGMVVGIVNGFPGDWTSDFSASFSGAADLGVPEPSSVFLLALGLGILARTRRHTSR